MGDQNKRVFRAKIARRELLRHDQKIDCPTRPGMSIVRVDCVDWQPLEPDPVLLGDLTDLLN